MDIGLFANGKQICKLVAKLHFKYINREPIGLRLSMNTHTTHTGSDSVTV